jgi:hypothetical protein
MEINRDKEKERNNSGTPESILNTVLFLFCGLFSIGFYDD